MHISQFDHTNIDELQWPDDEFHCLLKRYAVPLIKQGVTTYIRNVNTKLILIQIGQIVLPVTINEAEYDNAFVCSIYTHYISYAKYELREIKSKSMRVLLKLFINLIQKIFIVANINKVVCINNWLLTTNLYPTLTKTHIQHLTQFFKENYPDYAIVFRSLNEMTTSDLLNHTQACDYDLLGSRQVYILSNPNTKLLNKSQRRKINKDKLVIQQFDYHIQSLTPNFSNTDQLQELYHLLYIDKYSPLNPQFTNQFFAHVVQNEVFQFEAVQQSGVLKAILGYFSVQGIMTTPIFGYDTQVEKSLGLYRVLNSLTMSIAESTGYIDHASSGAAEFKRTRGYSATIEYNAVYFKHLSCFRRLAWRLLQLITNKIAVPMMQKLKL